MIPDLYERMLESAAFLRSKGVGQVDTGMILGSGLGATDEILDTTIEIPYSKIPFLAQSGAPGHKGVLKYGDIGGMKALLFCGRLHYYEGYPMWQVSYPVRILQALRTPRAITTAAVGGLSDQMHPGDMVLITDHINLMPENPLRGVVDPRLGDRFPDLTRAYDPEWSAFLRKTADEQGITLKSGVYAALMGPSLETQAECGSLRAVGADVVGMSVVPEVITGVQAGIRMAAICIVSNRAWHGGVPMQSGVEEILAMAASRSQILATLLRASCSAA